MALTQTAAQQATAIATAQAAQATARANFTNADGPDRARYLAEIEVAQGQERQARQSPTVG